ncbi:transcriptional regulator [Nonomuraea sp. NPDC050786]|uniref:transcriptional regulator n=1 Tax=Nonomuraea sp. NPDC050786 TaxID=3154840 RepID=UPI0033C83A6A
MARELRTAAGDRAPVAHPESLRRQIRGWEHGEHRPDERYRTLYAVVFDVPEHELFAGTDAAPTLAVEESAKLASLADVPRVEDVLARVVSGTGRRVGAGTVVALESRVHALRLADDVVPGGELVEPAFRQLDQAVSLYRDSSHREDVGRAMLGVLAELAQVAGWIAADAGQAARAASTYRLGLSAAREAGDPALESNLIGSLAYLTTNGPTPDAALDLAQAAVELANRSASPRARALAWDRMAWAQARVGVTGLATRALGEAATALTEAGPAPERPWLYWVSAGESQVMEARAYTELRRPLRAIPVLARVLDAYDTSHARELALYLSWLAVAFADAREPEAAAATAGRMFDLSDGMASHRTAERARTVLSRLSPYRADVPEVAELWERHRASTTEHTPTAPSA